MRSNVYIAAILMVASCANAQQTAPAQGGAVAGPQSGQAGAVAVQQQSAGQGVVNLLEVAKQGAAVKSEEPKIGPIQPHTTDAEAILLVDGRGKPIDMAKAKLQPEAVVRPSLPSIRLYRMSFIGDEARAILWVKGQYRTVVRGASVLHYLVGDIRDDGVCLARDKSKQEGKDKAVSKAKPTRYADQCPILVTFTQGVE